MTPCAVTGLGIVSALGIGREEFLRAMKGEAPARAEIQSFDATNYPEARVAEVPGFDATKYLGDKGLRTLDRLTKLLIVATRLALQDGGYKRDGAFVTASPERVGLVCSNAYGSLEAITELDRVATLEDARYINPAKFPNTVSNSAAGYASIWEDLRAVNVSVSDGNCGALDAVACAGIYFDTNRADALLVGGAEAMSEALFLAFHKLGAARSGSVAVGARGGTLIGEGAALFVTEPRHVADARGAKVLAELVGYGTSFQSPDDESLIFASSEAMRRAITGALTDAGVGPDAIDVVASGVAGLKAFDDAELAAIVDVVGAGACVVAPKTQLGETLGAGGAMGMAAALAWFDGAPLKSIVRGEAPKQVTTVLVTSMGYYGNASAVVMRKAV